MNITSIILCFCCMQVSRWINRRRAHECSFKNCKLSTTKQIRRNSSSLIRLRYILLLLQLLFHYIRNMPTAVVTIIRCYQAARIGYHSNL